MEDTSAKSIQQKKGKTTRQTYPHHLMTDFERFIGHENFGYYIFMAFAVKAIRQCLIAETVPNASEVLKLLGERKGEDLWFEETGSNILVMTEKHDMDSTFLFFVIFCYQCTTTQHAAVSE
jgi:hypothetical protein